MQPVFFEVYNTSIATHATLQYAAYYSVKLYPIINQLCVTHALVN